MMEWWQCKRMWGYMKQRNSDYTTGLLYRGAGVVWVQIKHGLINNYENSKNNRGKQMDDRLVFRWGVIGPLLR